MKEITKIAGIAALVSAFIGGGSYIAFFERNKKEEIIERGTEQTYRISLDSLVTPYSQTIRQDKDGSISLGSMRGGYTTFLNEDNLKVQFYNGGLPGKIITGRVTDENLKFYYESYKKHKSLLEQAGLWK